jgi:hypothetical protein
MTNRNLRLFSADAKTEDGGSPTEKIKKTYDPFTWRNSIVKKKKLSNFTDVCTILPELILYSKTNHPFVLDCG